MIKSKPSLSMAAGRTILRRDGIQDKTCGLSFCLLSPQLVAVVCESVSSISTLCPSSAAMTAIASASVVLPLPPFCPMTAIFRVFVFFASYNPINL
jgi:hypothetical protein